MTDHRGLQRALFRMQHDPGFAGRVRAGDAAASASTGLGVAELDWLRAADPAALAADRDGRRTRQLLRNVSSELRLAAALGPAGDGDAGWIGAFPRSGSFHDAVAAGDPLPLAFAAFAEREAESASSALFRALVALEAFLVRVRRAAIAPAEAPAPGAVVRAPSAHLLVLPAGTHAVAAALTAGAGAGALRGAATETVLVAVDVSRASRFGRLRALRVEPLSDLVAAFLARAAKPFDRAARAAFAADHGVEPGDVETVADEYVEEGVLLRGR
jgi:hypothetical protein